MLKQNVWESIKRIEKHISDRNKTSKEALKRNQKVWEFIRRNEEYISDWNSLSKDVYYEKTTSLDDYKFKGADGTTFWLDFGDERSWFEPHHGNEKIEGEIKYISFNTPMKKFKEQDLRTIMKKWFLNSFLINPKVERLETAIFNPPWSIRKLTPCDYWHSFESQIQPPPNHTDMPSTEPQSMSKTTDNVKQNSEYLEINNTQVICVIDLRFPIRDQIVHIEKELNLFKKHIPKSTILRPEKNLDNYLICLDEVKKETGHYYNKDGTPFKSFRRGFKAETGKKLKLKEGSYENEYEGIKYSRAFDKTYNAAVTYGHKKMFYALLLMSAGSKKNG